MRPLLRETLTSCRTLLIVTCLPMRISVIRRSQFVHAVESRRAAPTARDWRSVMHRRHALAPPSVFLSAGTMRDFRSISACVERRTGEDNSQRIVFSSQFHPNIGLIYKLLKKAL